MSDNHNTCEGCRYLEGRVITDPVVRRWWCRHKLFNDWFNQQKPDDPSFPVRSLLCPGFEPKEEVAEPQEEKETKGMPCSVNRPRVRFAVRVNFFPIDNERPRGVMRYFDDQKQAIAFGVRVKRYGIPFSAGVSTWDADPTMVSSVTYSENFDDEQRDLGDEEMELRCSVRWGLIEENTTEVSQQ